MLATCLLPSFCMSAIFVGNNMSVGVHMAMTPGLSALTQGTASNTESCGGYVTGETAALIVTLTAGETHRSVAQHKNKTCYAENRPSVQELTVKSKKRTRSQPEINNMLADQLETATCRRLAAHGANHGRLHACWAVNMVLVGHRRWSATTQGRHTSTKMQRIASSICERELERARIIIIMGLCGRGSLT